jgi:hypothetical protein
MQSNINAMKKTGLDQFLTNVIKNDQLIEKVEEDLFSRTYKIFKHKHKRERNGRNGRKTFYP